MAIPEFKEIIVSLYEKHYHIGIAALINSLCKSKFSGLVHIGYRDNLPLWISQLKPLHDGYYSLEELHVKFKKVESETHFGYHKPQFIKEAFHIYKSAERVYYFDPDIVVNAPWSFFENWAGIGVSLCLDNCFNFVHHNHPWRKEWLKLACINEDSMNKVDFYVNSGFLGINRKNSILLDWWIELTDKYKLAGGNVSEFEKNGHRSYKGDQDLLNAAITISPDVKFSIIGTEGMGFTQPAYLMAHAVGDKKPWKNNFFKQILKNGQKPVLAEKLFFKNCTYPIKIFSNHELLLKKINLKSSSLLGRLLG